MAISQVRFHNAHNLQRKALLHAANAFFAALKQMGEAGDSFEFTHDDGTIEHVYLDTHAIGAKGDDMVMRFKSGLHP